MTCMAHDDRFDRIEHDRTLGGQPPRQPSKSEQAEEGAAAGAGQQGVDPTLAFDPTSEGGGGEGGSRVFDPPYLDQRDYEFSLRLPCGDTASADHKYVSTCGSRFLFTVEAAEERVSRALRKQRRAELEAEYHSTRVLIWIERREPKAKPQAGNEERVKEAEERLAAREKQKERKEQFGRRIEMSVEAEKEKRREDKVLSEIGISFDAEKKEHQAMAADASPSLAPEAANV